MVAVIPEQRALLAVVVVVVDGDIAHAVDDALLHDDICFAKDGDVAAFWHGDWGDAIGRGAQQAVAEHAIGWRIAVINPHGAGIIVPINLAVELGKIAGWQVGAVIFQDWQGFECSRLTVGSVIGAADLQGDVYGAVGAGDVNAAVRLPVGGIAHGFADDAQRNHRAAGVVDVRLAGGFIG